MADLRLERGRGLLHGGKSGAAAAVARQEARQAGEAGRHQLGNAEHRDRGGMRQRKPQPLERERQRGGVEIHRREHLVVVGKHRRAVARAVEVGVDRRLGARKLIERGSHHGREAAERERVLHATRILRVHQVAAGEQPQQALRRLHLSGRGTQRDNARIERRKIGAECLERQRPGRSQRFERKRRIVMRERRIADAEGIGVEQRDCILRSERRTFDAGAPQRLRARQDRAVELRLPLADQREKELRDRREIGFAERADAAHARMNAAIQHRGDRLRRTAATGRKRRARCRQPDEQHGAHLFGVEEIPDPDRARHHGAMLELADVLGGERRVDRGAEPGIETIDRPIACGESLDHRAGAARGAPRPLARDEPCRPARTATTSATPTRRSPSSTAPDVSGAPPWP